MKYELNEIMTITEASELYNINLQTLKGKFKPSIVGQNKIDIWKREQLIRQSGKTWLITPEFMYEVFGKINEKKGDI